MNTVVVKVALNISKRKFWIFFETNNPFKVIDNSSAIDIFA